ncbi:unnamed protein product [Larinioides sclopetarius]|uniref:Uncharacterized protein n=1 Tax=Larinioides sclopetarius TaxID=280406 RepID=A0AAV1YSX5_9ARAC
MKEKYCLYGASQDLHRGRRAPFPTTPLHKQQCRRTFPSADGHHPQNRVIGIPFPPEDKTSILIFNHKEQKDPKPDSYSYQTDLSSFIKFLHSSILLQSACRDDEFAYRCINAKKSMAGRGDNWRLVNLSKRPPSSERSLAPCHKALLSDALLSTLFPHQCVPAGHHLGPAGNPDALR